MPKSKTTWSQDEIEDLVREYLWRSGLRPVEKSDDEDDGKASKAKRKPKTFQWGFKPRVSLTTEVEADPEFEEGEHTLRCHGCGQVVRLHADEVGLKTEGVETGRLDASQPNASTEPNESDPEPVNIPLDPRTITPEDEEALRAAQTESEKLKMKEKEKDKDITKKRGKMRGESGKRPY
jgi:hypothetical protein